MTEIDLRSDTVTRPSDAMRALMAQAEVGDDVYGEDPTVNRLEAETAALLGKQAALFVCSGTQSNLLALLSHCQRGDEYIVGQQAHTYRYEGGGAAVLGSIQPQPLDFCADGTLDLDRVAEAVKPDDPHFARTRLLCLENTQAGTPLSLDYLDRARALCDRHGLALHLDGARLCNAAVALGVAEARIAAPFDSVSLCLSKGLGAPVGSVLCGSSELVARARRWRKMLGGGMRQAGLLAAAGLHALRHNRARLAEDHRRAAALAQQLQGIDGLRVDPRSPCTNMVFVAVDPDRAPALRAHLAGLGMRVGSGAALRLVTHLDIDDAAIGRFVAAVRGFMGVRRAGATA